MFRRGTLLCAQQSLFAAGNLVVGAAISMLARVGQLLVGSAIGLLVDEDWDLG